MAHLAGPNDGSRPSDPKDLIFEGDRETPSGIRRRTPQFHLKALVLALLIGVLCVWLHYQITLEPQWTISISLSPLLYYASFGLTFSLAVMLSYWWFRR